MRRGHAFDGLLALILFCAFAASALAVLLAGASVYKRIGESADENYRRRTSLGYAVERARSYDSASDVTVGNFGGASSLEFRENIGGEDYVTILYTYDGALWELFAAAGSVCGSGLGPESGQRLLEDCGLTFTRGSGNSVAISDGERTTVVSFRAARVTSGAAGVTSGAEG